MRVCGPEKDLADLVNGLGGEGHRQKGAAPGLKAEIGEKIAEGHPGDKSRRASKEEFLSLTRT